MEAGIQKHCFNDVPSNCDKYGGLYRWYETAYGGLTEGEKMVGSHVQGICPDGWHIPSKEEFEVLVQYAGGMKGLRVSSTGWCDGVCNSTGFNAFLCGTYPGLWAPEETVYRISNDSWIYVMYPGYDVWLQGYIDAAYSVRCIKN